MKSKVITNNPLVKERLSNKIDVEYYDVEYISLLIKVRDKIHIGHKLLSHPLSGSIKPNETPYKSVIIGTEVGILDMESLMVIEKSLDTAKKFIMDKKTPLWDTTVLEDFQVIDLSLIENVLGNIN